MRSWQAASSAVTSPSEYVLTVTDPAQAAPAATRALVKADADVLSITESRHTLEDVYLELVEDKAGTKAGARAGATERRSR